MQTGFIINLYKSVVIQAFAIAHEYLFNFFLIKEKGFMKLEENKEI